MIHINNTSLRCRSLSETLEYAKRYAEQLGISRVTDITRLDRVGIPVFSSTRPVALDGNMCVNAGKGLLPDEARVGAYMEAIEFAMAEPNRAGLQIYQATPRDMLDGQRRKEAILDLCPKMNEPISLKESITGVLAMDLFSGQYLLVPAELAFMPYPVPHRKLFGSHTNGLSSGNSIAEAQIHGILEVIERDIMSFQTINNTYQLVEPDSYPDHLVSMVNSIESAGLELVVKYGQNEFGIPFFSASLLDHQTENPLYINGGFGCHTNKSIAITRAVTEAVQSRLSFIHGGRDDIIDDYEHFRHMSLAEKRERFQKAGEFLRHAVGRIRFEELNEIHWEVPSLEAYVQKIIELLKSRGIDYVLSVRFTREEEPLQVVKMIIPKLEFFTRENPRVGPRLKAYASKIANRIVWRA